MAPRCRSAAPRVARRVLTLCAFASIVAAAVAVPAGPAGAATADHLVFTTQPPASVSAGQSFSAVVNVQDALNAPVAGELIDLTDGTGGVSTSATSDVNGDATFAGLQVNTAGDDTLTATDDGIPAVTQNSNEFTVDPGPPAVIAFDQQPTDTLAGQTITPAVTVFVGDGVGGGQGNPVPGVSVTLSIATGPGTLSGTKTQTTDASGVATFADLSIDQPGTYTLQAVAAGGSDPTTISAPFQIGTCNGRIVFDRGRYLHADIYTVGPAGGDLKQVVGGRSDDYDPAWSPNGNRIAFSSNRSGNYEVWKVDPTGKNRVQVTKNPAFDGMPSWSPNGRRISFVSNRSGNFEIYTMLAAGGKGVRRLTRNHSNDWFPSWSPTGSKIVFQSDRKGKFQIFTMNADGSGVVTQLTDTAVANTEPSWSPDGSQIVFMRKLAGGPEIFTMNADGSAKTRITNNSANDFDPAWSPDGSQIVFSSDRVQRTYHLFTMSSDGTGVTQLTHASVTDEYPTWQATC